MLGIKLVIMTSAFLGPENQSFGTSCFGLGTLRAKMCFG